MYGLVKRCGQSICAPGVPGKNDTVTINLGQDVDVKQVAVPFPLVSPTSNSIGDSIKAVLSHTPQDLNAKQQAPVDRQSVAVKVSTISSLLAISSFNISAPNGAMDDTISTSQDFKIAVVI